MDHTVLRELAAGAALDDLEPGEREALDAHMTTCAPCRRLSRQLDDVVGDLALVAPALQPPADLRASVLTALREPTRPVLSLVTGHAAVAGSIGGASTSTVATPSTPRLAEPDTVGRPSAAGRFARWGGLAAAAVFAIATVGLGVQNQRLHDEVTAANLALADARVQLQTRQTAVSVVADPGHVTVPLRAEPVAPAAQAVVMFRPGTSDAVLMATDLPATPPGQVYQLWVADGAGVHPLGTYAFDGHGPFVAPFGVDLRGSTAAMVTLEPVGGAIGDPGPQVVFGEL